MFDLILMGYLAYRNSVRAKQKGQNGARWAFFTVIAYLLSMFIGTFVVIVTFCKDIINLNQFSTFDTKSREAATQQLLQVFSANPLHFITVELFGVGGYLLVRFILDKKPDKKQPEIHWMDKIGEQ